MCRIAMPILQASFVVLGLPLEAVRIYNVDYETSVIFFTDVNFCGLSIGRTRYRCGATLRL
jgi:hypothetical protein